jgi:hypothetical protein
MNLRTYIVKALYPLCSDEVQILLDQMQNNPDKFTQVFDNAPYRNENPWYRAMQSGNFELIDHVALRQQIKLLKVKYAKQLILEGLLAPTTQHAESGKTFSGSNLADIIKNWTDGEPFPEKSQPSKIHMNKAQYDIAKKFADAEAKQKLKANLQKAARN